MIKIKATNAKDIGSILDYVHDRIFQLSDIEFDGEKSILCIPLTVITEDIIDQKSYFLLYTWKHAVVKSNLVVRHVTDFELKDEAKIGEANINTIVIEDGTVMIKCSMPVEIKARVSSLEIDLVLSDRVVGKVSRFSIGRRPEVSPHK